MHYMKTKLAFAQNYADFSHKNVDFHENFAKFCKNILKKVMASNG